MAAANTPVVVRASIAKMCRSADTGTTWTEVSTKLPADTSNTRDSVVTLSADGSTLLHGIDGVATTYRSTNFASASPTWTQVTGRQHFLDFLGQAGFQRLRTKAGQFSGWGGHGFREG